MEILALGAALVAVVGIIVAAMMPGFQRASYEMPASFSFPRLWGKAVRGEGATRTVATPAIVAEEKSSATIPMPAITGMDRQVGEAVPDVFVDVGIWLD